MAIDRVPPKSNGMKETRMIDFEDYEGYDEEEDEDDCAPVEVLPGERFVRVSEDLVVDVLTGNQYMPAR